MKKERTEKMRQAHREKKRKHGNTIIAGACGAFLGAAAGGVLWVGLGQSRSLSALRFVAGAVAVIAAFKGYHLLGGKRGFCGGVLCAIFSLGALCLAEMADWSVFLYRTYHHDYDITLWDAWRAAPDVIKDHPEEGKAFLWDVLRGMLVATGGLLLVEIGGRKGKIFKGPK